MSDEENNDEPADNRMRFDELELSQPILKAVQKAGYEHPSPIQERAIPPLLGGSDFIGVAQTGTGKTAAFALPLLSRMDESVKGAQILVLAPTRELGSLLGREHDLIMLNDKASGAGAGEWHREIAKRVSHTNFVQLVGQCLGTPSAEPYVAPETSCPNPFFLNFLSNTAKPNKHGTWRQRATRSYPQDGFAKPPVFA